MKLNKEGRRLARELFRASLSDGRLDASKVRVVLEGVVKARPRGVLGVLKEYLRMARTKLAASRAVVESATPLEAAEAATLSEMIRTRFGPEIEAEFRVDPALLGGLRIQIGSDLWDGSVLDRLNRLRQAI